MRAASSLGNPTRQARCSWRTSSTASGPGRAGIGSIRLYVGISGTAFRRRASRPDAKVSGRPSVRERALSIPQTARQGLSGRANVGSELLQSRRVRFAADEADGDADDGAAGMVPDRRAQADHALAPRPLSSHSRAASRARARPPFGFGPPAALGPAEETARPTHLPRAGTRPPARSRVARSNSGHGCSRPIGRAFDEAQFPRNIGRRERLRRAFRGGPAPWLGVEAPAIAGLPTCDKARDPGLTIPFMANSIGSQNGALFH